MAKILAKAHRLWENQWGGPGGDQARAIIVDAAGRIMVAENGIIQNDRQIVLLVYDQNGSLPTEKIWGGAQEKVAHGLWLDGEFAYVAGETRTWSEGQNDARLLKVYIPTSTFPQLP